MLQVVPGSLDTAPCVFPTENFPGRGFQSIPLGQSGSGAIAREVLLQAWAVVLRYYVGSDLIAFGRIDDSDSSSQLAVCHGDIPATATLEELKASPSSGTPNSLPLRQWIASNTFNTLVWNATSFPLEKLEETSVCPSLLNSFCGC